MSEKNLNPKISRTNLQSSLRSQNQEGNLFKIAVFGYAPG